MTTSRYMKGASRALALAIVTLPIASVHAQNASAVRCSLNYGPERACRMTDQVVGETHRMTFTAPGVSVTFVAKPQTGWWAGKLNNKPAMGYERNRGNVVISTYDLSTNFAWWYPRQAHGTY